MFTQFKMYLSEASFTGDVNTYSKPDPQVYRRLIIECSSLGKEGKFSTSFPELQSNFPKGHLSKLKNLICLVKHWYQLVWHLVQPLWILFIHE